jgi:hypothetical protein
VQLLPKPFTYAGLAAKVQEILDGDRPPRILVVEDEALVRMVAVELLEELGFKVEEAGSAREAVDKLRAARGQVDAAIIDLGLPDSSGPALTGRSMRACRSSSRAAPRRRNCGACSARTTGSAFWANRIRPSISPRLCDRSA